MVAAVVGASLEIELARETDSTPSASAGVGFSAAVAVAILISARMRSRAITTCQLVKTVCSDDDALPNVGYGTASSTKQSY